MNTSHNDKKHSYDIYGKIRFIWKNLRIRGRSFLIYLCISVIPSIILGIYFYTNLNEELKNDYQNVQQSALNLASRNFESNLQRIENIAELLQSNQPVLEFISGNNLSVGEEVYNFLQYVRPTLNYIRLNNGEVRDIRIYNSNRYEVYTYNPVTSIETAPEEIREMAKRLNLEETYWRVDEDEATISFKVYKNLYNTRYNQNCGLMELTLSPQILTNVFADLSAQSDLVCLKAGEKLYRVTSNTVVPMSGGLPNSGLICSTALGRLNGSISIVMRQYARQSRKTQIFALEMIALLILTAAQFVVFNLAFERRLRLFANHMTAQGNKLVEYDESDGNDEIAQMIRSYNGQIRRIRNLVEKEYLMAIRNKEIEYYMLQAQIKPHFIFNTLENIRMNSLCNGDVVTSEMLYALGEFMRYNGHVLENATLSQEMENVRQYLKILSLRMGGELTFSEQIDVPIEQLECPQFILQPIVENAIEHGFAGCAGKKSIRIHIYEANDRVYIEVRDTGVGMEEEALQKLNEELRQNSRNFQSSSLTSRGIGLNNVNQRIKLFYGTECGLHLESRRFQYTSCIIAIRKHRDSMEDKHNI